MGLIFDGTQSLPSMVLFNSRIPHRPVLFQLSQFLQSELMIKHNCTVTADSMIMDLTSDHVSCLCQ